MLRKIIPLLLIATPLAVVAQPPVKGPLDGKTFVVDLYKVGKTKLYDHDDLKFNAGKFKSALFADWGFTKASKYQITVDSTSATKVYSWAVEAINDIKETMTWSGTITGEDIEGTTDLVNAKGETKYNFTFTGKLKGKAGKK